MKAGPVLGEDTVYVSGYNSPMNEPGQHPTLPGYDELLATRDTNKDGRVTKDEVDEKTREIFIFIDLDRDGSISRAEWAKNIASTAAENGLLAFRLGGKGELPHEGLKWTYRRSIPQLPTTLLYRGVLYMINDGGILTTLDPATGAVLKQGRLRGAVDQYYASPVAADGKVFFASRTGILSVLKAGGEQEVLAVDDFDEEIVATPAIADGRIYVRTKRRPLLLRGQDRLGKPRRQAVIVPLGTRRLLSIARGRGLGYFSNLMARTLPLVLLVAASALAEQPKEPSPLALPKPLFVGTPVPFKVPNLETPSGTKRPPFLAPAGTVNLARGKPVTASDAYPLIGETAFVTDGDKAGTEGTYVEFAPGSAMGRDRSRRPGHDLRHRLLALPRPGPGLSRGHRAGLGRQGVQDRRVRLSSTTTRTTPQASGRARTRPTWRRAKAGSSTPRACVPATSASTATATP